MDDTELPRYSASGSAPPFDAGLGATAEVPPPTYTPPTHFKIGNSTTPKPLVGIPEIKGHLALLHAFAELRSQADAKTASAFIAKSLYLDAQWAWFVGLAVERFDRWCHALQPLHSHQEMEVCMPPVDVIMVWHAYMLNPRWFAEDSLRVGPCRTLRLLEPHFNALLADPALLFTQPSHARVAFWNSLTFLPFDPFECMHILVSRVIKCPACQAETKVELLKSSDAGTGYLQHGFIATCSNFDCTDNVITKAKLAHRKIAWDTAAMPISEPSSHLAGTLFPKSADAVSKGNAAKTTLFFAAKGRYSNSQGTSKEQDFTTRSNSNRPLKCKAIMDNTKTFLKLRDRVAEQVHGPMLGRIMSAYNDDKVYSVDLVGAVLRQGDFVKKMHNFGWTRPGYFDHYEDELALYHASARYHSFLDLMSSSPATFFVPTLDIDLVWHTHQLMASKYETHTTQYVNRFVDHDDKVDGLRLSSAFDITCRAWKERFKVAYTHCGCPLPGDTIGERLTRLVGMRTGGNCSPSHLVPADREDSMAATHPSAHNAVRFAPRDERMHDFAKKRYEGHVERIKKKQRAMQRTADKRASKLQREPSGGLLKKRFSIGSVPEDKKSGKEAYEYGTTSASPGKRNVSTVNTYNPYHEVPFLIPVPLYYNPNGYVGTGCVADPTFVTDVAGSCSNKLKVPNFRLCVEQVPVAVPRAVQPEGVVEGLVGVAAVAEEAVEAAAEVAAVEGLTPGNSSQCKDAASSNVSFETLPRGISRIYTGIKGYLRA